MEKLRNMLYAVTERVVPAAAFQKMWAYYVKKNQKFDENRYENTYILSSKRGKKQYFVFRYKFGHMGIVAVARSALMACEWAQRHKMIPIIDYEWGYIYEDNKLGIDNMWESIFIPITPIEQVMKEDNVLVGFINDTYSDPYIREKFTGSKDEPWLQFADENWREYYKKINVYAQKWWRFREDVLERFTDTYRKLFRSDMKILGIALREEFSLKKEEIKGTLLEEHPHQLGIEEMIPLIKQYMEKWNCTHLFVTTQMEDSIRRFQEEFGDKLLFTDRGRVEFDKFKKTRSITEKYIFKRPKEFYEWINSENECAKLAKENVWNKKVLLEYLEEIYGLSLCDCLLAGKSGGSYFACVWNGGKYDALEILPDDNGSKY